MSKAVLGFKVMLAAALLAAVAAHAEPGDDDAVAQAKKEYEQAMRGHDLGLQNATKIQLQVQMHLAKARQDAAKKEAASDDVTGSGKKSG